MHAGMDDGQVDAVRKFHVDDAAQILWRVRPRGKGAGHAFRRNDILAIDMRDGRRAFISPRRVVRGALSRVHVHNAAIGTSAWLRMAKSSPKVGRSFSNASP